MVGTRHAVSDNKSKSGLGMPSPYIPEREQIQDRKAELKRETEYCGRCTQRPYHSPLTAHPLTTHRSSAHRKGGGDYSRASGHIGSTSHSVRASHRSVLPSQGTDGHSVHLLKGLVRPYRGGYGEGPIINPLTKSRFTPCQHEGHIALCPVTLFLLGRYPERILIYKINKNHLHCPIFIE